jgi:hypothetical protein
MRTIAGGEGVMAAKEDARPAQRALGKMVVGAIVVHQLAEQGGAL